MDERINLARPLLGKRPARGAAPSNTPLVGGARMESINWKLHERHHRHKLAVAYLSESEFAAPPFAVGYKRFTRKEFTLEVLRSSYPAGRASLYSVDGVPVFDSHSHGHSSGPLSPPGASDATRAARYAPSPLTAPLSPSGPGGVNVSRLPSALLYAAGSRRVEQLVGGFVRTRDVRSLDPVLSREFGDALASVGLPQSAASPAQSLILVRCGAIVIRLLHLRAVVVHDGLYLALDSRADGASAAEANAVRSVALRLGASTHEDRLGPEPSAQAAVNGTSSEADLSATLSAAELLQPGEHRAERLGQPPPPQRALGRRRPQLDEGDERGAALSELDLPEALRPISAERAASGGGGGSIGWGEPVLIGSSTISSASIGGATRACSSTVGARPATATAAAADAAADGASRAGQASREERAEGPRGGSPEPADEGREPDADLAPFPLRALEALFDVAVDDLRARLLALNDEAASALEALRRGVADSFGGMDDALAFEAVRSLRERVRTLILSVKAASAAVAETLDDDVQMAFM
jgi:hypothetical protein